MGDKQSKLKAKQEYDEKKKAAAGKQPAMSKDKMLEQLAQ